MATKLAEGTRPARKAARHKPTTPDAIEIAMEAAASGKPLPDAALNVLEKHARLIDCQADLARAQTLELKLRKIGEGVRAALWAILAVAAFAVVALVAAVLVRAARSDALIVQSFRVPPALAAEGLTGEVVATQVLDKLAEMQARTESVRAASTYANNWEDELKIDIPNTGATTGEVWKLLRGWLGKETRISGEVIQTPTGLALTARVGSKPGQRFESATGDLDALVTQGAELIYRHTQPYRYAVYLPRAGRPEERYAVLQDLTTDPSAMERKWAYSGLSYDFNTKGRFRESVAMAERALAIDPDMAPAMANGGGALQRLGRDQEALEKLERSYRHLDSNEYDPRIAAQNGCYASGRIGYLVFDPQRVEEGANCLGSVAGTRAEDIAPFRMYAAWLRHDPGPLRAYRPIPADGVSKEEMARDLASAQLFAELIGGDKQRLAAALDGFRKAKVLPASAGFAALYAVAAEPTQDWPTESEALIQLGRVPEAAALIARTPRDCYPCVRVRGLVAEAQGDAWGAQRWFAEAVRQGPRLPQAYFDWARLLARHGHYRGAEIRFAKAAELSRSWPDPHKYWADMLVRQGRRAEALKHYDLAVALGPNWASARAARGAVRRVGPDGAS